MKNPILLVQFVRNAMPLHLLISQVEPLSQTLNFFTKYFQSKSISDAALNPHTDW